MSRRAAWISALAAAVLFLAYYYNTSGPQADLPSPPKSASDVQVPRTVSESPVREAAPRAPKFALNGVVMVPASKAALISVDGRPAALFMEGQPIGDGVLLYAVRPDGITIKRDGELERLPLRRSESTGSTFGGVVATEPTAIEPSPVPPAGTEERRIYQGQNRD